MFVYVYVYLDEEKRSWLAPRGCGGDVFVFGTPFAACTLGIGVWISKSVRGSSREGEGEGTYSGVERQSSLAVCWGVCVCVCEEKYSWLPSRRELPLPEAVRQVLCVEI